MKQHQALMRDILANGHSHEDRTGVGRISVFGRDLRFDLKDGFPLVTTRKVFYRGMIEEMLWMLSGSTDVTLLQAKGVKIWDAWAPTQADADAFAEKLSQLDGSTNVPFVVQHRLVGKYLSDMRENIELVDIYKEMFTPLVGTIGPLYSGPWRGNYGPNIKEGPDQIELLVEGLKTNPYGSRHTVTAQIPALMPDIGFSPKENVLLGNGALAPCHCFFQCFVTPPESDKYKKRLSLKLQIRSSDCPVGLPYNIAQYALLLEMLAQCTDMESRELIVSLGDAHVYRDQVELVKLQLEREPLALPRLQLNPAVKDIFSFKAEDITLIDYNSHPVIKYPVAT